MVRNNGATALLVAAMVAVTAAFPVAAGESDGWVVTVADGAVTIDGQAADATASPIGPGAVIETGADGTVVLSRPGDSVTVFPNSRISVPASENGAEPGILQMLGKLLLRMESRQSRDFEVKTPYLAAAIKGTTFTVEVGEGDTAVEVSEGSVLVTANRSGHSANLGPGERGRVSRDGGDSVRVSGTGNDDGEQHQYAQPGTKEKKDKKDKKDKKVKKDKKPKK